MPPLYLSRRRNSSTRKSDTERGFAMENVRLEVLSLERIHILRHFSIRVQLETKPLRIRKRCISCRLRSPKTTHSLENLSLQGSSPIWRNFLSWKKFASWKEFPSQLTRCVLTARLLKSEEQWEVLHIPWAGGRRFTLPRKLRDLNANLASSLPSPAHSALTP